MTVVINLTHTNGNIITLSVVDGIKDNCRC